MKILLVNDDGIDAVGIRRLVEALSETHTVWIAAPDRQRSAASMAMTLNTPLRADPREIDGVKIAFGAFIYASSAPRSEARQTSAGERFQAGLKKI